MLDCATSISHLEIMTIIIAVKVWAHSWSGRRLLVKCDNAAAVSVIRTVIECVMII